MRAFWVNAARLPLNLRSRLASVARHFPKCPASTCRAFSWPGLGSTKVIYEFYFFPTVAFSAAPFRRRKRHRSDRHRLCASSRDNQNAVQKSRGAACRSARCDLSARFCARAGGRDSGQSAPAPLYHRRPRDRAGHARRGLARWFGQDAGRSGHRIPA